MIQGRMYGSLKSPRTLVAIALVVAAAAPAAAQRRTEPEAFTWSGRIPDGRWIMIRNVNGPVEVVPSTSDRVEIVASRHTRRGDPEFVKFEVKKFGTGEQDVLVCALWGDQATCDETGYRSRGSWSREHDINVEFRVMVPRNVKVAAYSTNGEVRVRDMTSEVDAETTNGSVTVSSASGPVNARTTNGSVRVSMGRFDLKSDLTFETTNGSVIAEFAQDIDAEVDLRTVNGRFLTDFPVTVSGRIDPRRLRATLGKGGPRIRLATPNGNVELRRR
jgi:Putative adhesin